MKHRLFTFILVSVLMMTSGCSILQDHLKATKSSSEKKSAKSSEKKTLIPVEVPEELKGIDVLAGPGKYIGDAYDVKKVKAEVNRFPKNLKAEEYLDKFHSLVSEDYRPYIKLYSDFNTIAKANDEEPGGARAAKLPQGKKVNVQILFDSSGSMAGKVDGGVKMELAKEAIKKFSSQLPEGVNISLRVYGHKGSNSKSQKGISCKSTDVVYPVGPYREGVFQKALNKFRPAGWTPLANSIRAAAKDLNTKKGDQVENIIYVVSDGVETCGGDPVAEARKLSGSNTQTMINIIGFDVDNAGQRALKKVAEAGKGTYSKVDSEEALEEYFEGEKARLIAEWEKWESRNVDDSYKSESQKLSALESNESKMVQLAELEEERIRSFTQYMESRGWDSSITIDIRSLNSTRGIKLRDYARDTGINLRDEVRNNELDRRNSARDKALDKRNKLRE
ncbi:D-amino-acid dehydrogenase/Ca-activated chloride channel family protein [Marininema mesophilum]|uniref:D-amino-acid dehydrogenase/Ca-activated chloride channel family protein n=1 Tax=Marininema mesophilum TaxID=1048340 RepID=A0A1H2PYQ8_9BACL|nr:VWA domain-containing protein [Marininema mesophilum]SDV99981.1 D-amino-acid dehydrogenase/Ca-activated chloride channel family protein [Marininema mesophilum]